MIKPENTADVKIAFAVFFISSIFYIIHTASIYALCFCCPITLQHPACCLHLCFYHMMIDSLFLEQLIRCSFLCNYTVF